MKYKQNNNCLICNNNELFDYLDLGSQPLANSYHKGDVVLEKYPLQMRVCKNCWHSQLSISVDPAEMFEHYLYISDTSKTLNTYFEWVTDYILKNNSNSKKVLEIACNSGVLLEKFKNKNLECVGVDPARNLRELSKKRELDVYVDYWNIETADKVKSEKGLFDLVLAFHVLPHVQSPVDFINACKNVISENGTIYLQTSQCDMFLNNEFDAIYHEHTSYFTARSIQELARKTGMYVSSIIKTDIHSKSFLFSLQKQFSEENQLNSLIRNEIINGITNTEKYKSFAEKANETKNILLKKLQDFKSQGYILVGYGAAAKGNTLLNYINFKLDYIIDDNELKCGYKTPGMDIDIHSINLLATSFEKICFLPLAWNFYTEIKERIKQIRHSNKDVFVKYFPSYSEELSNDIKVFTNNPVAINSDDHLYPEGIYYDNNLNINFCNEIEQYYDHKKINFLDLGCAGGELVCHMYDRGHNSVGLEGSDHCLNVRPEMVKEVGFEPLGHKNWKLFGNKILFTCDITKDYTITNNSKPAKFDFITCFDVMEHFTSDEVDNFLKQLYKHTKHGGLFIAQIALYPSGRHSSSLNTPENINYHKSVFPREWWLEKISSYFVEIKFPFTCHNRSMWNGLDFHNNLIYAGRKI
jgi:2-polyprenyl-3-methyl-5-hydroxy-6-metoxy-1,4-benzoquinol methylase